MIASSGFKIKKKEGTFSKRSLLKILLGMDMMKAFQILTLLFPVLGLSQLAENIEKAFLVKLTGCTGSLIAEDWVITAAHCFQDFYGEKDGKGGLVINMLDDQSEKGYVHKEDTIKNHRGKTFWAKKLENGTDCEDCNSWRKVTRLIKHKGFISEAMSWQGYDIALLQLEKKPFKIKGAAVPICLPKEESVPASEETFVAGYGFRQVPHCITDGQGPETFEVCGRPHECAKEHMVYKCGLDFLSQGEKHTSCLKTETPSSKDPECIGIRKKVKGLEKEEKKVHVFNKNQEYLTTCYPEPPPGGGWCTTRAQGVAKDTEPEFTRGWGYCSQDPVYRDCNKRVGDKLENSSAIRVSILEESYCVDKIEANLKVEQEGVEKIRYSQLSAQNKIICTGKNSTSQFAKDIFYQKDSSASSSPSYMKIEFSPALEKKLLKQPGFSR